MTDFNGALADAAAATAAASSSGTPPVAAPAAPPSPFDAAIADIAAAKNAAGFGTLTPAVPYNASDALVRGGRHSGCLAR